MWQWLEEGYHKPMLGVCVRADTCVCVVHAACVCPMQLVTDVTFWDFSNQDDKPNLTPWTLKWSMLGILSAKENAFLSAKENACP